MRPRESRIITARNQQASFGTLRLRGLWLSHRRAPNRALPGRRAPILETAATALTTYWGFTIATGVAVEERIRLETPTVVGLSALCGSKLICTWTWKPKMEAGHSGLEFMASFGV